MRRLERSSSLCFCNYKITNECCWNEPNRCNIVSYTEDGCTAASSQVSTRSTQTVPFSWSMFSIYDTLWWRFLFFFSSTFLLSLLPKYKRNKLVQIQYCVLSSDKNRQTSVGRCTPESIFPSKGVTKWQTGVCLFSTSSRKRSNADIK